MKSASIADAKNRLSACIDMVRRGESVLITDRNKPVARRTPLSPGEPGSEGALRRDPPRGRSARQGVPQATAARAQGQGRLSVARSARGSRRWAVRFCDASAIAPLLAMAGSDGERPSALEFVCFDLRLAEVARKEGFRVAAA